MLYRKAYDKLLSWKNGKKKKTALFIEGVRQCGKTTVVEEFAKNEYRCFAELNFLTEPETKRIFEGGGDISSIIEGITAYTRRELVPGETLILLDEIGECPEARTAVKMLVEDGRFDYVETGSLLGIKNRLVRSLPVGFEENYKMYPMDFEEFLTACGVRESTIGLVRKACDEEKPLSSFMHEKLLKLFYVYIIVGGMPRAVQEYVDSHDIAAVIGVQNTIIGLYQQDIAKYAELKDRPKIRAIFDSIPNELNSKNRRFRLASLNETARMERYEDSFNWLVDAGVALPCYNVSEPSGALKLNEKRNLLKLFLADTGLLCALSMDNVQFEILGGNLEINMGSILENMMAQIFTANGFPLHYFDSKKYGEVDFVLQRGSVITFVEIKSGADYRKHTALDNVMKVENWKENKAVVFSRSNIERENGILYLPWYAAPFFFRKTDPVHMIYEVDVSSLNESAENGT